MAKQKGIVALEGTLGGISFYMRKGKAVARAAGGGFNGEKIRKSPSMVRVRENATEFGFCSRVKKAYRLGLMPLLGHYKEPTLHGRMMQLFQQVKACDLVSARGQRRVSLGVQTPSGGLLMRSFSFTPQCTILNVVPMTGVYDAVAGSYSVGALDSSKVVFPKGADHLALQLGVYGFDFEQLVSSLALSEPQFITKDSGLHSFTLAVAALPAEGLLRFGYLKLQFYQEVNGELYALKEADSLGVMSL